jgi:hypothetical protein
MNPGATSLPPRVDLAVDVAVEFRPDEEDVVAFENDFVSTIEPVVAVAIPYYPTVRDACAHGSLCSELLRFKCIGVVLG